MSAYINNGTPPSSPKLSSQSPKNQANIEKNSALNHDELSLFNIGDQNKAINDNDKQADEPASLANFSGEVIKSKVSDLELAVGELTAGLEAISKQEAERKKFDKSDKQALLHILAHIMLIIIVHNPNDRKLCDITDKNIMSTVINRTKIKLENYSKAHKVIEQVYHKHFSNKKDAVPGFAYINTDIIVDKICKAGYMRDFTIALNDAAKEYSIDLKLIDPQQNKENKDLRQLLSDRIPKLNNMDILKFNLKNMHIVLIKDLIEILAWIYFIIDIDNAADQNKHKEIIEFCHNAFSSKISDGIVISRENIDTEELISYIHEEKENIMKLIDTVTPVYFKMIKQKYDMLCALYFNANAQNQQADQKDEKHDELQLHGKKIDHEKAISIADTCVETLFNNNIKKLKDVQNEALLHLILATNSLKLIDTHTGLLLKPSHSFNNIIACSLYCIGAYKPFLLGKQYRNKSDSEIKAGIKDEISFIIQIITNYTHNGIDEICQQPTISFNQALEYIILLLIFPHKENNYYELQLSSFATDNILKKFSKEDLQYIGHILINSYYLSCEEVETILKPFYTAKPVSKSLIDRAKLFSKNIRDEIIDKDFINQYKDNAIPLQKQKIQTSYKEYPKEELKSFYCSFTDNFNESFKLGNDVNPYPLIKSISKCNASLMPSHIHESSPINFNFHNASWLLKVGMANDPDTGLRVLYFEISNSDLSKEDTVNNIILSNESDNEFQRFAYIKAIYDNELINTFNPNKNKVRFIIPVASNHVAFQPINKGLISSKYASETNSALTICNHIIRQHNYKQQAKIAIVSEDEKLISGLNEYINKLKGEIKKPVSITTCCCDSNATQIKSQCNTTINLRKQSIEQT